MRRFNSFPRSNNAGCVAINYRDKAREGFRPSSQPQLNGGVMWFNWVLIPINLFLAIYSFKSYVSSYGRNFTVAINILAAAANVLAIIL